jgi:peptide/nickel transport system substrate-binding protein
MTDNLDGLFNPFYSTSASDGTIVSMTQIGMLTSGIDENGNAKVAYGPDEAVVTLDYASSYDSQEQSENPNKTGVTTYTFVIKNGLKYSDGAPLTIEDVLFNLYVYLDPVYTGSSTMYSTDILGLSQYRTQQNLSGGASGDEWLTSAARTLAGNRINELINLFKEKGKTSSGNYSISYADMRKAILAHTVSSGYKEAISNNPSEVDFNNLLADYELALKYFKDELKNDYKSAQEAYTEIPYKNHEEFKDPIFAFMCYEGLVTIEYEKDPVTNKDIKTKIKKLTPMYSADIIKTEEEAIEYVYNRKISTELDIILRYWGTAQKLETEFLAKAKEVLLKKNTLDGELTYPNISGIVSLGHTTDVETVTVNGKTYTVAHEHNEDGTPKNAGEYDVLEIKINGIDPKAVWNFSFAVAPQHYYAEGYTVDIKENKFGVEYGSFDFMIDTIQSQRNVSIPMGAGAYMATNNKNEDEVEGTEFFSSNVVYFKANPYFEESLEASLPEGSLTDYKVNINKVRYQVVPANDALTMLTSGTVHYVTPQLTKDNAATLNSISQKGYESISVDQLGYGYIGINAGEIPNIYLRRAIMAAMDTSLALQYYDAGTAEQIFWPMSTVSWAYPKDESGHNKQTNGHTYPYIKFSEAAAIENINSLMTQAYNHSMGYSDADLKVTFTIAGSDLTDHPTYQVFQTAAKLLNQCGWSVEVIADTQALTKLSTGSLAVWAAAWGTTVDPDMYQVYHKNSNASSVKAWGYNHILANESAYFMEMDILNKMSEIIDDARETDVQADRTALYEQAMGYVLDLAIELPVYQRKQLYAYNANIIDASSFPEEINPYSSPLDRIWEISFTEGAASGGSSTAGIIVASVIGAGMVGGAIWYTVDYRKKANRRYVIPIEEIDREDLDAYHAFYKKKRR